jgi:hypothetical protein
MISDTGPGIGQKYCLIFLSLYYYKICLGLGLSICYGIIQTWRSDFGGKSAWSGDELHYLASITG